MPCLANSLCIASPDESAVAGGGVNPHAITDENNAPITDQSGTAITDT